MRGESADFLLVFAGSDSLAGLHESRNQERIRECESWAEDRQSSVGVFHEGFHCALTTRVSGASGSGDLSELDR
jgi:hypothetical protein